MIGGNMMGKMSSKFTQFQKPSTPSATNPTGKPTSSSKDWKKWGTRAAIGVAAVGALALGAEAMDGGIFDGMEDSGGGFFDGAASVEDAGGDFSGGGYGDTADIQLAAETQAAMSAESADFSNSLI
jgi:hypothetical protein